MGLKERSMNPRLFSAAIGQANDCIVITDPSGTIQYVNSAYTALTGYTAEEAVGQNARIHSSGEHSSRFYDLLWATIRAGRVWHGEMTNRRKDGSLYRDEMRISPVVDADGKVIHYIAIKRDVTEQRERDRSIARALEFAQGTIDALSSNICVLDESGNIIAVNRAWNEFARKNRDPDAAGTGCTGECFAQGRNYLELCEAATGEDARVAMAFASGIRAILRMEKEQFCLEYPCHSPEKKRWFMGRVTRFHTARPARILLEHIDITERRLAEDALLFQNALLEGQAETTLDGILVVDDGNHIVLANSQFAKQFEIPTEVLNSGDDLKLRQFIANGLEDPDAFYKQVAVLVGNRAAKSSDEIRLKNGRIFDRYSAPLSDSNGQYRGRVWYHREITERKASEARIESLAYYDVLTKLPNRYLMQSRLETTLAEARANGGRAALLFLDLDRFKIFNDSLGHGFGDLLLKEIAGRLQTCLKGEHFISRIGGDEFLIILDGVENHEAVSKVAARVLNSIGGVLEVQGRSVNIHCSIGISVFPEHGTNAEDLIRNADAAMFCAKDSGRNKFQFFTEEMQAEALKRLTLENDLHLALERGEFFLVYQPQMNIGSRRVSGFEALIRWRHPKLGLVPPDEFIAIAESCGLILPIGAWVLETACRQARQWQKDGLLTGSIAVNVSAVQFSDAGFVPMIRKVLSDTGLNAEYLELELTESLLLSHADMTSSVLKELKNLGVTLAIDDFGTGYSSLGYLKRFRVGRLKIDRSFISELTVNPDDAAITTAIISMARSLRLGVIAEGVESEEQLSFLREHGCDEIQGYLLGMPLEAGAIQAFLEHARARWERQVSKQPTIQSAPHMVRNSRILR